MPSRRQVLAGLGAVGVGSTAGCLGDSETSTATTDSGADWPMADYDPMGTSYNVGANPPTTNPTERWSTEVGWPTGRPVVADGTVYMPTHTHLHAFDVGTGDEQWQLGPTDSRDAPYYTNPAVHEETVYVGDEIRGLLALDATDGSEQWQYDVGDERTGVEVGPVPDYTRRSEWEALVVGDSDSTIHYVDIETGDAEWTFEVYGRLSKLLTRGGVVYAGTEGGEVYALYDAQGMWRRKLPGGITALAATDGGEVIASTFGGGVFRLRDGAHAGRTAWHAENGPVAQEAFVVADGRVYGTDLADATVLDERTGEMQWEVDGTFGVPPAGAGDTLYLGGDTGITAYKLNGGIGVDDIRFGGQRWHYAFGGAARSGVTVADSAVFAVDGGGEDTQSRLVVLE